MLANIGFDNLKISCVIGHLPEEWEYFQTILVDLRVEADISKCAKTDNIEYTINYVSLADTCTKLAQNGKYKLLETYAADVLDEIFKLFPAVSAYIKVKKPKGLESADYSFIELSSKRG